MPSARSSPTRTAWRSRAPMRRRASSPSTKRSAELGRVPGCRVMFVRPEAKPLIRVRRARSMRKAESDPGAANASRAAVAALPLKIESPPKTGRRALRRGRLAPLRHSGSVSAAKNANVALLEPEKVAGPCAEELARINESLQARERLLTASARASRLLLEAPDVRVAIPGVLGMIGEAARRD